MAHLKYAPGTGHLLFTGAGHLSNDCAGCAQCTGGTYHQNMQVVIAGLANSGIGCTSCASLNGTFVLAFNQTFSGTCIWSYDSGGTTCNARYVGLYIGSTIAIVRWTNAVIGGAQFAASFGDVTPIVAPIDCGFSGYSIPVYAPGGVTGNQSCDGTSATCTITAL